MLGYVTRIDPTLSVFGWKVVGLTHAAMVLPAIGAFLPRHIEVEWNWIFVVLGMGAVIGAINVISFVKMIQSEGYRSPPMGLVFGQIVLATVAAGILSYAIGGMSGIYRPLIFVPTLLMAIIANRWVIVASWAVATATVTVSMAASGVVHSEVVAVVLSYGIVWGITCIMVHLLAVAALHSDDQVGGLADMAGIAARVNNLDDGVAEVLPVIATLASAERAGAFRAIVGEDVADTPYRFERLDTWTAEAGLNAPGTDDDDGTVGQPMIGEIDEARVRSGVALRGRRALLMAEGTEGDLVAVVVEGMPQRPFDELTIRFNFERMAAQIAVLVDRSRYVARLEDLGRTDGLTGLANRRSLFAYLDRACVLARRREESLAVVMTDLDRFKTYNDSFGHLAGDDLLRNFALQFRDRTRSIDFVARYGGEEFVLVLPDTDGAGARSLIAKLQERFRAEPSLKGITFSAGIAVWNGSENVDTLINRADTALYAAKAAGRDQTVLDAGDPQQEQTSSIS